MMSHLFSVRLPALTENSPMQSIPVEKKAGFIKQSRAGVFIVPWKAVHLSGFQDQVLSLLEVRCSGAILGSRPMKGLAGSLHQIFEDTPAHNCLISSKANISAEWRNNSIPLEEENGIQRHSRCTRYKLDVIQRLSDNGSVPGVDVNLTEINQESCDDGWEYDRGIYVSTIVTEWDLVCGDSWKVPMTTSVMSIGVLCGTFLSGQLSDRFGRKILMFGTIAVKTAFIVFQIFSTSWLMFTALIFIVGTGNISNYLVTFVLGAEILSPKARIIYSTVGVGTFFSLGYMLNPLLAFFIRDWRTLLAAIIVPGIFYIPLWW
ncbi:hypothetical protein GJAV_G00023060 [Gymnothorax javanicus]|nr:hypothetical protein GJAV_G00023060 [Gymnothorax javanicus]